MFEWHLTGKMWFLICGIVMGVSVNFAKEKYGNVKGGEKNVGVDAEANYS